MFEKIFPMIKFIYINVYKFPLKYPYSILKLSTFIWGFILNEPT